MRDRSIGESAQDSRDLDKARETLEAMKVALGSAQGLTPPAAFLLGRSREQGEDRGRGGFERLAPPQDPLELLDRNRRVDLEALRTLCADLSLGDRLEDVLARMH